METMVVKEPRRSRKRRFRVCPRPALPVRGLWEAASAEEKAAAHKACIAILEWWVGRRSRESVAAELQIKPLRAWQLSQSALSGMLAGLLRQPRRRGRAIMRAVLDDTSQDVAALKKELAEMKRRNEVLERLVMLLRDLPASKERSDLLAASEKERPEAIRRAGEKRKTPRVDAPRRDGPAAGDAPPSR